MCTEVIGFPIVSKIEEGFDQVLGLFQLSIDRDILIKKIRMFLVRYVSKIFEFFPAMLTGQMITVDRQKWANQLKANIDSRINIVINEDQTNL